jgi:hypothetical protein
MKKINKEYWDYLTSRYSIEEKQDGLLHFLVDIFDNIEINTTFKMSKELIEVMSKIRDVLTNMSDTLHKLYTNNKEEFSNIPDILKIVNVTIQKIPDK